MIFRIDKMYASVLSQKFVAQSVMVEAEIPVVASFSWYTPSDMPSFPRRRESGLFVQQVQRLAEWIPAGAGMTAVLRAILIQKTPKFQSPVRGDIMSPMA